MIGIIQDAEETKEMRFPKLQRGCNSGRIFLMLNKNDGMVVALGDEEVPGTFVGKLETVANQGNFQDYNGKVILSNV